MSKLEGTTLEILEDNGKGKVLCACKVCNHIDVYDKKYLLESNQECRYCRKLKILKSKNGPTDAHKIATLSEEERLRKTGALGALKSGREYIDTGKTYALKYSAIGDDIEALGVYGKWGETGKMEPPTHLITRCLECGAIKLHKIPHGQKIVTKYFCTTCIAMKNWVETERAKALEEFKSGTTQETKKAKSTKQGGSAVDTEAGNKKVEKLEELYRKTNPDHFVKVDLTNGVKTVIFSCKRCGAVNEKIRPNKNYKVPECIDCALMLTNRNYRGLCKQNLIGRIYNGMEIVAQYTDPVKGYLCDIKCAICGTESSIKTGIPVIDVVDKKHFHDCDYYKVDHRCPNCNSISEISITEIKDSKDNLCKHCNSILDKSKLQFKLNTYDMELNFNRARRKADGTTSLPRMLSNAEGTLLYDETPIYSSDNENYFRCVCIVHGTRLVLPKTELRSYSCKKCYDIHEDTFKTLKAHNIRIKGNERIK